MNVENKNLGKILAKQGAMYDLCRPWYDRLKSFSDKKDMIEMYLNGIDFCLANDYPSNDFIRENFKGEMENYGIFLDDQINLINPAKCVALGLTSGKIEINGFSVSEIFVKHESYLSVSAADKAFVMIDAFDDTVINVSAHNDAKVCVNRYGHAKIINTEAGNGRVKIIDKFKKTY